MRSRDRRIFASKTAARGANHLIISFKYLMHENHVRFEIIIVQQKCKYYLSILAYCPGIFYGTKDFETSSPRVSSPEFTIKF